MTNNRMNLRNKSKRGRNGKSLFLQDIKQKSRVEGKRTKRRERDSSYDKRRKVTTQRQRPRQSALVTGSQWTQRQRE